MSKTCDTEVACKQAPTLPAFAQTMKLALLDCDSTLSAIEGIDELGRARGEAVFRQVEAMTHDAMNGKLAVEAVFGRRLEIIQPRASDVAQVAQQYIDTIEPTALATVETLRENGWTVMIVSGGFRNAIRPLADQLGIARIEAVDLFFNADGSYRGYDVDYPTTRSGGKPEIIARLKKEFAPQRIVMIGDGVSDLETMPGVDLFVGFGRYTAREKVKAGAHHFILSLSELPPLLAKL